MIPVLLKYHVTFTFHTISLVCRVSMFRTRMIGDWASKGQSANQSLPGNMVIKADLPSKKSSF